MAYPGLSQPNQSREAMEQSPAASLHTNANIINKKSTQKIHSQQTNQSPPNTMSPSASNTPHPHTHNNGHHGPWINYQFPSKWEYSDDFMCVHFIPRTADKHTWNSQCLFWSEAIQIYSQQLLSSCPHSWNRLTFTPKDIINAYTRKNRLTPMCIIDILKWMKYYKNTIELASNISINYQNEKDIDNYYNEDSMLSISGVSNMVSSMFGYFMSSSNTPSDDEDEVVEDYDFDIQHDTKCIYIPIMKELCDKMSNLQFYKRDFQSDLSELINIGIIQLDNKQNEFIINGLVFYRFCVEILKLTIFDIMILKKYLIQNGKIALFYINENEFNCHDLNATFTTNLKYEFIDNTNYHDLKNEMIYFGNDLTDNDNINVDNEQMNKMQLLSIQMTMKHLKFQKIENENNLNQINSELITKLKNVPTDKRKQFMASNMTLIKRKKWLKNRISNIDGSIYNLETTLHTMEDMSINKMVFNEMKNADKMLKSIIKEGPSIEQIETMQEDIKESMEINSEIGDTLAKPMDTDYDIDDDELLKEYNDLEMQNAKESLPNVPNHDIVINDAQMNINKKCKDSDDKQVIEQDDDTEIVQEIDNNNVEKENDNDNDKEVLMN